MAVVVGVDDYTMLCLHCDGINNSNSFRDASNSHRSITVVNALIKTAQYKFGGASGYFAGNGYVYAADSDDWHFGSGDFTLDLWAHHAALPSSGSHAMFMSQYTNTSVHWNFRVSNVGGNYVMRYEMVNTSAVAGLISSALSLAKNEWHHYALVRYGNIWTLYFDGVSKGSYEDADAVVNIASSLYVGSWGPSGGYYFNGYMDEVRISKGVARWTEDFTPPEGPYCFDVAAVVDDITTHDEAAGDTTDTEVDSSVVLLLHGEGDDASTTIVDSSPSHKSVTRAGHAQIDTAQKKFGAASILFDGTTDYVYVADSADWYLGTGDFTIDFWVRFAALPTSGNFAMFVGQRDDDNNRWTLLLGNTSGVYRLYATGRGGSGNLDPSRNLPGLSTNTWYHFAFTRAGNSFKWFMNGNQISTEYTSSNSYPNLTSNLTVGARNGDGAWALNGWIDELRIVKGKAIWTASFDVPTEAYAILDHHIEHVTSSEDLVPDPGLPTDAEFTDALTTNDWMTHIAGADIFAEIDEDLIMASIVTPNQTFAYCLINNTVNVNANMQGNAQYNNSTTENLTIADTVDGQFNISMYGFQTFPKFSSAGRTGLGFNSGVMKFPVFTGIAYAGARSSIQEIPKFGLSGTMQIQYPFGQAAKHPKFNGVAAMTVGKVANGDADFPLFSGTGTMIGNPQVTGDIDFPVFGGNGGMSVGGRFANYVLRYVR